MLASCMTETPSQTKVSDGTYNLHPRYCSDPASEGRVIVSGNEIRFHESTCMGQSGPFFTEGQQTRLICTGEGEEWERLVTLQDTPDLLTIREGENSPPYIYHRCP